MAGFRKYVLLGFVMLNTFQYSVFAQNKIIDSLLSQLKKDNEDTNKVKHLNALGWQMMYSNPDTSIALSNLALSLAEKLRWKKAKAISIGQLGVYYYLKSGYPKALDYFLKALKLKEELGNKNEISKTLANIGNVYFSEADYPKALEYYQRALKLAVELGNKNGIAIDLANIGNIYYSLVDYPKALKYYLKALKMSEELGNKNGIAANLANLGVIYKVQGNYDKALNYSFKSLKFKRELGNKNEIAITLGNIGSTFIPLKKYTEASLYLYSALALSDSIGAKNNAEQNYQMLSLLYEKSSEPLPDSIGGKILNREQMRLRALYYFKRYMALRDTIFSEENKKQLIQKEMNFDFDKKEAHTKAEQEKKDLAARDELQRQRILRNCFVGGFAMVFLLALLVFRSYRQKQKSNKLLAEKNAEIEEKNKGILDSIRYAKRIQTSLLPTDKYLDRILTGKDKKPPVT
ncbi:MAG TPA: tetratricopeptide repeat protein [Bacteroidia bacterium]|jgi:tetratricopeptide (TPR) repeat protein|nr:tetratricopeptide repeat protein [Bacteroidia bacterium]